MSEVVTPEWLGAGLAFRCTGCGDCCTGAPGFVWVNAEEIAALAAALGLSPEDTERQFVRRVGVRRSLFDLHNGDCVFFDAERRNCRVYDARPAQCRTYPFWQAHTESREAWDAVRRECEGARESSPLIGVEEIRARVRENARARERL